MLRFIYSNISLFSKNFNLYSSMILSDNEIKERSLNANMISPFSDRLISKVDDRKIISYGLSSYGYDVRVANEFKIFTNAHSQIVDPKNFSDDSFISKVADVCIIPPNSFVLARTIERIKVPRDILVLCVGKSTYARCGIVINVTPLEPEWEGYVTLEFSNTTPLPAKIYANEGCCQFIFFCAQRECIVSYLDRNGKYQGQAGIVLPII